ncbi:MAG: iron-containing alcohol dehydrogenase [Erysipelotrichaceae bacterium]|nr:iron-containing alcohol dehydrogenase [Erysipelotrichaceae bacterium]
MTNDFTFQNTTKVHFGRNAMSKLSSEVVQYGHSILLVYGGTFLKKCGLYDKIVNELKKEDITIYDYDLVKPNPRHTDINIGGRMCRDHGIEAVLGIGGGSAIDSAKAIAALALADTDNCWDLVTAGKQITKALPIFTIPTMASTGSEMDASCVISNLETEEKKGYSGPAIRPTVTFDDPTNTFTVPAYQTACGSVDIMSHTLDTKYFSKDDKMDMLYRMMDEHLATVVKWAPVAYQEPENYEARSNLMWAAAWALNSFMTCGVRQATSVHAMEHELSAVYDMVHGHGIAILMPRWMRYILNEETAPQIARLGYKVYGVSEDTPVMEAAEQAIERTEKLYFETLGLKSRLSDFNIDDSRFEEMAKNACGKNGVIRGYVDLTPEDVVNIYRMCL